ncbi:MAG: 23S rRNA (guanosine(2251)-2'-O)-methyltransferase RlmB [Bacteroidia bacterium]|nr:23S rRNA (guanosine(2251)-2'-O)-methyltransferase RlmB [Bacteroidia bacterium]
MFKDTQIYGLRAVIEAVHAGKDIQKVFMQKGLQGALFKELEGVLRNANIPVSYVPYEKLNKLTRENHQGVVAQIAPVSFQPLESTIDTLVASEVNPLILILDEVSDVRNFGAILRTAECVGVHAVIFPDKGSAPVNADTVKTSAGAVFNIPLIKVAHLKDAIYYLQASGISVIAATEKTDSDLYKVNMSGPSAILMGSEGRGISPALLKLVEHKAAIPMRGQIGSLNVSVAAAVFLYEALRQRLNQ